MILRPQLKRHKRTNTTKRNKFGQNGTIRAKIADCGGHAEDIKRHNRDINGVIRLAGGCRIRQGVRIEEVQREG